MENTNKPAPIHLLLFTTLATLLTCLQPALAQQNPQQPPLRVGVAGLVHTHVHWILGRENRGDIEIAGIAEPNRDLAQRYARQHGYSMDIVYPTIEEMLEKTKPEAVLAFNTIYGHLEVVEILEAAKISAKEGRRVALKELKGQ